MASERFDFGEVPVSVTAGSAQRATPGELVGIAQGIWGRIKASGVAESDDEGNAKLLEGLQSEFADFGQSFPLVLRWMVQMRRYNSKAFGKYLHAHASARLDTRESFLQLQAEYLVLLYKAEHPRYDERLVGKYREGVVAHLLAEDKAFTDMQEEVEADMKKRASQVDAERRQALYQFLLAQKVSREARRGSPEG